MIKKIIYKNGNEIRIEKTERDFYSVFLNGKLIDVFFRYKTANNENYINEIIRLWGKE